MATTYDEKVYDLASQFLEDEPNLFTLHHNHHLACAIQAAIEEYIAEANSALVGDRTDLPPSLPVA